MLCGLCTSKLGSTDSKNTRGFMPICQLVGDFGKMLPVCALRWPTAAKIKFLQKYVLRNKEKQIKKWNYYYLKKDFELLGRSYIFSGPENKIR